MKLNFTVGNTGRKRETATLLFALSVILQAYPYLEEEDLREALAYASWRVEEIEAPLVAA